MTDIIVRSQTQRIIVNPHSKAVSVVNAGPQGPRGLVGPSEAAAVLTVDGQLLTRVAGVLSPITRAALATDLATQTAFTSAFMKATQGSGAPAGTGTKNQWYYDTAADRLYMSDGTNWIVMYEPVQTVNATTTNITLGTNGSVKHYYQRSGGRCFCTTTIDFGTSGTKLSLTSGHTITLPKTPKRLQGCHALFFHSGLGAALFNINNTACQFGYLTSFAAATAPISDTAPYTWALNDIATSTFDYEMNTPYL